MTSYNDSTTIEKVGYYLHQTVCYPSVVTPMNIRVGVVSTLKQIVLLVSLSPCVSARKSSFAYSTWKFQTFSNSYISIVLYRGFGMQGYRFMHKRNLGNIGCPSPIMPSACISFINRIVIRTLYGFPIQHIRCLRLLYAHWFSFDEQGKKYSIPYVIEFQAYIDGKGRQYQYSLRQTMSPADDENFHWVPQWGTTFSCQPYIKMEIYNVNDK